ncbi:MAG: hypothetical protein AMS17_16855 [Spirochaetes bacterium DG_61]|nr:MAG: hypothetical protein AMS17_16855 [Spirochaetes bacterium DG_61]
MLKPHIMDLHIHTCLSPCGAPEMVPTRIISRAKELHLDAIGVCDHNAAKNVEPVQRIGHKEGIAVFAGMEVTTREEIHVIALFGDNRDLTDLQELVWQRLYGENNSEAFGPQYIVDKQDYVRGICRKLLIGAADLSVDETVSAIHRLKGLAIASHIDREVFSITSQLGFIPEGLRFDALELSARGKMTLFEHRLPDCPIVSFSDAHHLNDIGRAKTTFSVEAPTFDELKKALNGLEGRKIIHY